MYDIKDEHLHVIAMYTARPWPGGREGRWIQANLATRLGSTLLSLVDSESVYIRVSH